MINITKLDICELAKEVIEKKIIELSKEKDELESLFEFNNIFLDFRNISSKIYEEIKTLSEHRKLVMKEIENIKEIQKKDLELINIINLHTQIIEHKIEESCGGIGGPQQTQIRYEYTLEEKI